jgi:hypothetical protein
MEGEEGRKKDEGEKEGKKERKKGILGLGISLPICSLPNQWDQRLIHELSGRRHAEAQDGSRVRCEVSD